VCVCVCVCGAGLTGTGRVVLISKHVEVIQYERFEHRINKMSVKRNSNSQSDALATHYGLIN
jgi:hypothetical protein